MSSPEAIAIPAFLEMSKFLSGMFLYVMRALNFDKTAAVSSVDGPLITMTSKESCSCPKAPEIALSKVRARFNVFITIENLTLIDFPDGTYFESVDALLQSIDRS